MLLLHEQKMIFRFVHCFTVASNAVLGDAMVIIGSTFYAFSNVGQVENSGQNNICICDHMVHLIVYLFQEFLIKNKVDLIELMAFMGLFGALISGCQVYPFSSWSSGKSNIFNVSF